MLLLQKLKWIIRLECKKEADRVEAEHRKEAERVEAECRKEAERVEAECKNEAERVEAECKEGERMEAESIEADRMEAENTEADRVEAECKTEEEHKKVYLELCKENPVDKKQRKIDRELYLVISKKILCLKMKEKVKVWNIIQKKWLKTI